MNSHYQNLNNEPYVEQRHQHLSQQQQLQQQPHGQQLQNVGGGFSGSSQYQQHNNRGSSSQVETKPEIKNVGQLVEEFPNFTEDKKVKIDVKQSVKNENKISTHEKVT